MICDALEHLNRYRGLHRNLDTAIDYLTAYHVAHDLYDLPLGRTEVDGENVFINVMEADLSPDSTRLEYHKKYADLQIDLTGGEGWGYTNLPAKRQGSLREILVSGPVRMPSAARWARGGSSCFSPASCTSPAWHAPAVLMCAKWSSKSGWRIDGYGERKTV